MVRRPEPDTEAGGGTAGGIVMLGQAIGDHWYAVVRDVLALGYRADDILTTLSVAEMVAIVSAAPPNSSLRDAIEQGWSRTDQLLANINEQNAGVAKLQAPYERPGTEFKPPAQGKAFNADSYTWDEFDELNKKRYTVADDLARKGKKAPGKTSGRVFSPDGGVKKL